MAVQDSFRGLSDALMELAKLEEDIRQTMFAELG